MKDIMLKITGKTVRHEDGQENQEDLLEFVTEGKLYNRGDSMLISYPESELSGLEGWTTYLAISDDKIKMKRSDGKEMPRTIMEFELGKRYEGKYDTPYGNFDLEIVTNSISPFTEENNKLSIDYNVSLHGLMEARNKLDIEIMGNN